MYGGLVHHSRSVWSSDRISAPSQHGVHYGGVSPLRARTAKVFTWHWQEKFERRRTVLIYTEFRGLASGSQPSGESAGSEGA